MSASFKVSDVTARETDDRPASADLSHKRQRIVSLSLSLSRARTSSPESWNQLNRAARHNQDAHRESRIATGNEKEKRGRSWKPEGNCSGPRGIGKPRRMEGCLEIAMFNEDASYALNRVISPADLAVVAEFPAIRPRFSGVRLVESRAAEGGLNNRAYIAA